VTDPSIVPRDAIRSREKEGAQTTPLSDGWDVVVVGGGPAGSIAAYQARMGGARTLLIDRAHFPRYKTCGGGLIGATLNSIPDGLDETPVVDVFRASFTLRGRLFTTRRSRERVLSLVNRDAFDAELIAKARSAGVVVWEGTKVTAIRESATSVELETSRGGVFASAAIGADGSSSRVARFVGVATRQVDLGLEVELDIDGYRDEWGDRIHLDWGPLSGSYAWVFPKRDSLTVGVIASKGHPDETREYLRSFLATQGLDGARVLRESGHLTRCRTRDSPLGSGRILLVGDAAGLLEPWTREGISYAIRSGRIAGRLLAEATRDHTQTDWANVQDQYRNEIERDLGAEMEAGRALLAAFRKAPWLFYLLLARTERGWRQFARITRGETSLARAYRHRSVRWLAKVISLPGGGRQ